MSGITTIKRASLTLVLGLGLVACDSGDSSSSSEDDETSTASAPPRSGEPGGSKEPSGGMSSPPSSGPDKLELGGQGSGGGQDRQAMMKKRIEMMKKRAKLKKAAIDAAEAAESEGNTPCEKAFHAAIAVDESMREQLGKQPSTAEPSQDKFVSTCTSLPEGMRKCLVPSYARGNQQECAKEHKGLGADSKKTLQQLMAQVRGG